MSDLRPSATYVPSGGGALHPLGTFIFLYAALYSAFGVASPFMPSLIESRGVSAEQIGVVFGLGTAVRLVSAPLIARLADRSRALRLALAACAVASATAALGYLLAWNFWTVLMISLLQAVALAPLTNLADALALAASRGSASGRSFEYGWVRGSGSAAFIVGSLVAGAVIAAYGLTSILMLQVALMLAVPVAAACVPSIKVPVANEPLAISREGVAALIRLPAFRRVVLVAALILGSHAMHDTFAVIRWRAAGVSSQTIGLLWSAAVAGEVVVFFVLGPWLLKRLTPAGAIALAASAAALRWSIEAFTVATAALAIIQPLHGVTFALLHLTCMRLLASIVPPHLAATAQAIYGTVGIGAATAAMTLLSGWLYGWLGPHAFVAMALLSISALPVAASLQGAEQSGTHPDKE